MQKLFSILLIFGVVSFAPHPSLADDGQSFYVQSASGDVDLSALKLKSTVIIAPPKREAKSHFPTLEEREDIFLKSGLTQLLLNYDSFDRDSLYLDLRQTDRNEISYIVKRHPDLQGYEIKLKKAQRLIHQMESE